MSVNMALTPSQIQGNSIISALRDRKAWDDVDATVKESSSLKKIK